MRAVNRIDVFLAIALIPLCLIAIVGTVLFVIGFVSWLPQHENAQAVILMGVGQNLIDWLGVVGGSLVLVAVGASTVWRRCHHRP